MAALEIFSLNTINQSRDFVINRIKKKLHAVIFFLTDYRKGQKFTFQIQILKIKRRFKNQIDLNLFIERRGLRCTMSRVKVRAICPSDVT